jgi:antitoxin CptB
MTTDPTRLKRLHYRAWHRGTREADYMVGGFFDAHSSSWNEEDLALFERLIDEQDVDIIAWAFGRSAPPEWLPTTMADALQRLDYIRIPR